MNQVIDAMMPFFKLAIVLFVIETVFDMFWREHKKAKAAMDAGTKFSVKLTNSKTLEYRIVGINHDDLADGSGKAGLTFESTNNAMGEQRMSATETGAGGWEKSELRSRLNTGDLWSLCPPSSSPR